MIFLSDLTFKSFKVGEKLTTRFWASVQLTKRNPFCGTAVT